MQDIHKPFIERLEALRTERSSFVPHWQELSEYFTPRRGRFLVTDRNDGQKKHQSIIDNTGTVSARTLASGMMSGITSPSRPWFRLTTPDPEMAESPAVKNYLFQTEERMRNVFARSNLYNALHTLYGELAVYGTASMAVLEDFDTVIRCYPFTVGEYFLANDHKLTVNTFYREYQMTVGQIIKQYGLDNASQNVKSLYQKGSIDSWITVVHAVEPNDDRDSAKRDNLNMPYRNVVFEKGAESGRFLENTGFREFPFMSPRWDVVGYDVYGSNNPGMLALGDVKQLQTQQKRKAQGIDKMVNPPLKVPSQLQNKPVSALPGGATYYDPMQGREGLGPLYEVNPRLQELMVDMQETQQRIQRTFFADLFLMLSTTDRRQITAREIEERHEEKLLQLGPVLERLHAELLDPLIDRVYAIMERNDLLPPPPPELNGVALKVEYISILAQAQKMVGIGAVDRLIGYVANLAQMDPSVMDKVNLDQSIDDYGMMLGVNPKLIVPDDEAQAQRQQKAQAQQAQMAMEQAPGLAKAAKDASEVNAENVADIFT